MTCNNIVAIVEGKFTTHGNNKPQEKQTDVNLATYVMHDLLLNIVDLAIIISNDSDFVPIIKQVKRSGKGKIMFVCPPSIGYMKNNNKSAQTCHQSNEIKNALQNEFQKTPWKITCKELIACRLPNKITITLENGKTKNNCNPYITIV